MVFVYTAMGVLCVEHANVLELCYIELLSGAHGSPYCILSDHTLGYDIIFRDTTKSLTEFGNIKPTDSTPNEI